jgi:predicted AAA+ superfamily ATPase
VRAKAARSLGARAQSVFLGPIQPDELPRPMHADLMEAPDPLELPIDAVEAIGRLDDTITLQQLWLRGGLPPSLLADDASSFHWRRGYLADLFELPAGANQFRACLEKIAANQGRLMSLQKETKAFAIGLDLLDRMGLVRRLRPWFKNTDARLTKTPKFYIRDSGLLHALNNCRGLANVRAVEHLVGASWEGFCIEAIAAVLGEDGDLWFYRTDDGAEADLVIEFSPTESWVIEIKSNPDATIRPGFNAACAMIKPSERLVVHGGEAAFVDRNGLEALPLNAFLARLTDRDESLSRLSDPA